jgi:hypothetical protein
MEGFLKGHKPINGGSHFLSSDAKVGRKHITVAPLVARAGAPAEALKDTNTILHDSNSLNGCILAWLKAEVYPKAPPQLRVFHFLDDGRNLMDQPFHTPLFVCSIHGRRKVEHRLIARKTMLYFLLIQKRRNQIERNVLLTLANVQIIETRLSLLLLYLNLDTYQILT